MSDGGDAASRQEAELLAALHADRAARQAAAAVDAAATAEAAASWTGVRRLALPAHLAREARRSAPRGRVLPLGALPRAGDGPATWQHAVRVGGVERLALHADPPATYSWRLDLQEPAAACGWFALRPDAWAPFIDPVELTVRQRGADGAVLGERTVRAHPAVRMIDRRWIPWRLELAAAGPCELELETRAPLGIDDGAWTVIGEPVLDLGGRPLATPRARRSRPGTPPQIAILMPVHDPPLALLERTISSVLAQQAAAWELCICDDGSRDPAVIQRLQRLAAEEPRVRLARHETAGGISAATNTALGLATAPYVATLDHDDLLAPDAIAAAGEMLARDPSIDLLYSDNDLVAGDGEVRFAAALKPDWSPDLMRAVMYTLHLGIYRRALVEEIGGWQSAFDGAQDHDLVLRLSERTTRIAHLPRVLAHWRAHAGSAALGELAKPTAYERGRAAVAAHLERLGIDAEVERLAWAGRYRVRAARTRPATVVLARGGPQAESAWRAALRPGDDLRLLDPAADAGTGAWRTALGALAGDEPVLLVEPGVTPAGPDDVDELLGLLELGAAAAGGLVTGASGTVLAGAIAFPAGLPIGLHLGADAAAEDRHPSLTVVSNRLAVRGVVALRARSVRADVVRDAGTLALAAFTLARGEAGERVVFSPHARFTADEPGTAALRRTALADVRALDRGALPDPYWNPQRRADLGDESYDPALHDAEPAT